MSARGCCRSAAARAARSRKRDSAGDQLPGKGTVTSLQPRQVRWLGSPARTHQASRAEDPFGCDTDGRADWAVATPERTMPL
jgi:hypothetical protein